MIRDTEILSVDVRKDRRTGALPVRCLAAGNRGLSLAIRRRVYG